MEKQALSHFSGSEVEVASPEINRVHLLYLLFNFSHLFSSEEFYPKSKGRLSCIKPTSRMLHFLPSLLDTEGQGQGQGQGEGWIFYNL